jgi:hypothetical protein
MRVNWRDLNKLVGNVGAREAMSEFTQCSISAQLSVHFQLWCGKECRPLPPHKFLGPSSPNPYAGGKGPRFR